VRGGVQVTDKYREAGKIVNFALQAVISQLAPGKCRGSPAWCRRPLCLPVTTLRRFAGKSIAELCEFGDAIIEAQVRVRVRP